MALQHLYSRVPAKMSLFNKTDGYDTFAHSDGVDAAMIKTIATVYDNKPTQNDIALIQNDALPPVYCQYSDSEGRLYQSCVTFLEKDYTGERSAYMVHSLVFSDEEKEKVLLDAAHSFFNADMFVKTLDGIDLTSFDSHPDTDLPEIEYKSLAVRTDGALPKQYDKDMLYRLIFALLNVACGKTKAVYLSLPYKTDAISEKALAFLNELLQIFPFHLRHQLSFVTYVGDTTKYSAFKIRVLPETAPAVPATKGVSLRFGSRDVVGFTDDTVKTSAALVDFFFGLLSNDAVRREFLLFADHAVKTQPALGKATLKNLNDLVFLFKQCSGLFPEMSVLPDDAKVYEFVCVYDKNRTALTDEYRANALKCLWRYPNNRLAIPKNVFSKVASLYPKETAASKTTVMNIVLELIHTDIMRDKLFTFIKNNYDDETDEVKATIINDLSRVYYGGFLQPQILTFFDAKFDGADELSRDTIVEKVLLTIRTPAIQNKILEFFGTHYAALSEMQKERLYTTFYEMLSECDALSTKLCDLIASQIDTESQEFRAAVIDRICKLVEADQRKKEPKLLGFLAAKGGFCGSAVVKKVFVEWSTRKVFDEYLDLLWTRPFAERFEGLADIWQAAPDMSEDAAKKLTIHIKELFSADTERKNLFDLMKAEQLISEKIAACGAAAKAFAGDIAENCVRPALLSRLGDALQVKAKADGLQQLLAYVKEHPFVAESEQFQLIRSYTTMLSSAAKGENEKLISAAEIFASKDVKRGVADRLQADLLKDDTLSAESLAETKALVIALIGFYRTGEWQLAEARGEIRDAVSAALRQKDPNAASDKVSAEADLVSLQKTFGIAALLYSSDLPGTKGIAAESDIPPMISAYVQKNGKKGQKELKENLPAPPAFAAAVTTLVDGIKPKSAGIFSKLFSKK